MPQSLPDTTPPKRRFHWPTGMPQLAALLLVLLVDSLVAPHFWQVVLQDGRLFGSPIDILNRAAPVALLAIGMTLVIATGGIDLCRGGDGYRRSHNGCDDGRGIQPANCFVKRPGHWHPGRIVERHTGSDPQNSAVCRHPDPDGRRARRGATDHLRADRHI